MKTNKILAAALIAAFGFTSCAKDKGENIDNGNKGVAEVVISFGDKKFTRAEGNPTNTEAPVSALESEVNLIEVFAFNGASPSIATPDATTPYFRKELAADENLTTTRFLVTAGQKTFLVAVNAEMFDDLDEYNTASDKTYATIKASIADRVNTSANSKTAPATGTGFAMAAEGSTTVVEEQANQLSLTLNRVLSKVYAPTVETGGAAVTEIAGVPEYLEEIFGSTDVTNLSWTFDGYVVINGIDKSYNFRYVGWTGWSSAEFNWNNTTYTDATGATIATVYAGSGTGDMFLAASNEDPVYIYENKPAENEKINPSEPVTYNRDQVTGFLIKGHFTATVDGTVATDSDARYWRVNLLKKDTWEVFRNSVYRVNLKNILTPGYTTPKDAEEEVIVDPSETSIAIDLIIAEWDLRIEDIDL